MQSDTTIEVQNLISLISNAGQITVRGGQLLVSPPAIAKKYGDEIRRLKPEILIAGGYCPTCAVPLVIKIEESACLPGQRRHVHCQTFWHYDSWRV